MFIRCLTAMLFLTTILPGQEAIGAGTYLGTWAGGNGGGDIHMTLGPDGKGGLAAQLVGFTIDGQEVTCKVLSTKITGSKIEIVYEFDLQGNKLQSAIAGAATGKILEGTYKTTAGDQPVDQGTWKVTAKT